MTVEIRPPREPELRALVELDGAIFGYRVTDEVVASMSAFLELPRVLAAFDGARLVGAAALLSLELTLPGGARVPMAGVTWVGVRQTHRRRGLMRRLVTEQLESLRGGREVAAGLGAAESQLYRRFGFGIASRALDVEIDTARAAWRRPLDDPGSIDEVELAGFLDLLPDLFERVRQGRNGGIDRSAAGHRVVYREAPEEREGAAPMRFVVHRDPAGAVDGALSFRLRQRWTQGLPDYELRITELLGTTPLAEAALWRHCLDHDLVRRVVAEGRPLDEPLGDLLDDPRQVRHTALLDHLHLRPLDVPALLGARRYGREDALTLEVRDPLLPWAGGRLRLEAGLAMASCVPDEGPPDLVLDPAALGSILLGDAAVERLWRAGLVEEHTPGAVRRATAMFAWAPAPWLPYMF